jgi:hypothetical protein
VLGFVRLGYIVGLQHVRTVWGISGQAETSSGRFGLVYRFYTLQMHALLQVYYEYSSHNV